MVRKVVIIGGVAGGASCAARLRRLDEEAEIVLVERGSHISFANCGLPYHIGSVIPERESLFVQTAEAFRRRFRVRVLTRTEAVAIDPARRTVRLRDLEQGTDQEESYDQLVLSPGAEPVRPPIPGVQLPGVHVLRNIADMDGIIAQLDRGSVRRAAVVGGGFIGLETAENLVARGVKVTLIEMLDQVMPLLDPEMAAPLAQELALHGVEVRTGVGVQAIRSQGKGLALDLKSGEEILADLVILSVGVRPEVQLARAAGLQLGPAGGIQVDPRMRTSDPAIYAVGDAVEVVDRTSGRVGRVPLAGPANRQGRLVADVIVGRDVSYPGALGTSIVQVFDRVAASTGVTEKQARRLEIPFQTAWVHGASHAGYYPGATPLTLKLLFEPETGRILGGQAVGQDGVDKRIDVIATALAARMTVFDLETLDLAYAPPFSSAKDPVNHLGAVAANMLRGDHPTIRWDEIEAATAAGDLIVDVRTAEEFACGTLPGAVNIPLDELRDRLDEIPRERRVVVTCRVGLRGYLALRILLPRGYRAVNLLGGYKLWHTATAPIRSGVVDGEQVVAAAPVRAGSCAWPPSHDGALPTATLDACGLSCPGPILRLKESMDKLRPGEVLEVVATDPGFVTDLPAWAGRTGNEVLQVSPESGKIRARLRKGTASRPANRPAEEAQTIVVFSGELDRAMAALIIATGAASMGRKVTLFFTFWGLNLLRSDAAPPVAKSFTERMFGAMMPRGARRAKLSRMHFGGMGTAMMRQTMTRKNVDSLPALLQKAHELGVRLVACQMSMDVMGIRREELIDGVEVGGVASYLDAAADASVNLFI